MSVNDCMAKFFFSLSAGNFLINYSYFFVFVLIGHVHKYEAVLQTLEKLRKTVFCYKMINFSLRECEFFLKKYFSYTERLTSSKVEKVLWLQRNDKKVTLLLIYHISGF